MREVVVLSREEIIVPGLLAHKYAQQACDAFMSDSQERGIMSELDFVMDMRSTVERWNGSLEEKLQAANHFWYVRALLAVFPVYYALGETEKAESAYKTAKAWALDECLIGLSTSCYTDIEAAWARLRIPWYRSCWKFLSDICQTVGEYEINKGRGEV